MNPISDIQEINAWLKLNIPILRERAPHEIAYMATVCGFDLNAVCSVLGTWCIDARLRNTEAARLDFVVGRELRFINERAGNPSLALQWRALARKIMLGKDFDE